MTCKRCGGKVACHTDIRKDVEGRLRQYDYPYYCKNCGPISKEDVNDA